MTPREAAERGLCESIAHDSTVELKHRNDFNVDQKIENCLFILSYALNSVSERDLRFYLALAGIDLTDPEEYDLVKEFTTWYVSAGALDLFDLITPSLLDPGTTMYEQGRESEHMKSRIDSVVIESKFFREFLLSEVNDL